MAGQATQLRPTSGRVLSAVATVGVATALAAVAVGASGANPDATTPGTLLVVVAGATFILGAGLVPGSPVVRGLMAGTGAAWLLQPFVPGVPQLYLAILGAALAAFPDPSATHRSTWAAAGLLATVCAVQGPRGLIVVALAVLAVAVAAQTIVDARRRPGSRYPPLAAGGLAAVLGLAWVVELEPDRYDTAAWILVYELAILLVALGYVIAARRAATAATEVGDLVLGVDRLTGFDALERALGDALSDPTVRVYRWDAATASYVDGSGKQAPAVDPRPGRWLAVDEQGAHLAAVASAGSLDDPPIARSVAMAVRLAVVNLRGQAALESQLRSLTEARARLVVATDRQREATARRLHEDVVVPVLAAVDRLDRIRREAGDAAAGTDSAATEGIEALRVARDELAVATEEMTDLIAGVPPARLGGGQIVAAVRDLAARCPVPTIVETTGEIAGETGIESALFYACSEALTNVVKHAEATRILVELAAADGRLTLRVSDDGRGTADPAGSGLVGLADRLAAYNGRLRVSGRPGAGTELVAEVPA